VKRILLAIGSSEIGGAQKVFITLIKELIERGYNINLVVPKGPLLDVMQDTDLCIHTLDFKFPRCFIHIFKILREKNISLIHTHLTKCSFLFGLVNLLFKKPMVCTLHNEIIHSRLNSFEKRFYPIFYFILSYLCSGIIVVSKYLKAHIVKVAKVNSKKITVIYNGIEIGENGEFMNKPDNNKRFTIGYIGRLSDEKGVKYLIESLHVLKKIDFECFIVGDGPLRIELEQLVRHYELSNKVRLLGFCNDPKPLMQQMDVIVVPSVNETFSLTIVESFLLKKVVIASNVGGIPELVIDGQTGFLFPVKDSSTLAEKILYVYNNKKEAQVIAMNGYEYFKKHFTSKIMAENTITYYHTILANQMSPKQ